MRADDPDLVSQIEEQWSPPSGFLFELRQGLFDPGAFQELMVALRSIEQPTGPTVPRRLVSLLWYIPEFVGWQRDRVTEAGGDSSAVDRAQTEIRNELERILGVP